jgi:hypothetical protein
MGRQICTCTENGIVTVLDLNRTTPSLKVEICPRCYSKYESPRKRGAMG